MSDIVCVRSESTGRMVRIHKGDLDLQVGDRVLVESELGGDLAVVVDGTSTYCHNPKASRLAVQALRKASPEDIRKFEWLREREARAYDLCLQRIAAHGLAMKLVAVRYFFSEKKGIFYYTADGRIDFRQLVKDLAKELRMRIEMRQVGPGRLRPLPVLLELHDQLRAGDHPEGPQAADRHQSDQDLGPVRAADVLPRVRGDDARADVRRRPPDRGLNPF
ncbi:MAG: PSP1 domain-containing protein [Acidobacteria bacterium]|nr:PSP1 domain-containing protein [Acidobacteriota bacterium]